ncbi:carbohydrate ABC transporter permease [Paenibacillus hodogayensis]|uniref:Carbohydrate ABC transporter permease n=1 Tax=Paenibacillus hodogayensis TaxID=279208 RepID=A0ABV5VYI5_9BACL
MNSSLPADAAVRSVKPKARQGRAAKQKILFLLIAIAPSYGGYLLFTLYPNLLSVYYSLLSWDGISAPKFVGLDNYIALFQDKYVWRALLHNLFFMAIVPISVIFVSLLLGYVLANKRYRGTPFFKVLFFFPNVLSTVVIALLWAFIYDGSFGLLNGLLRLVGIPIGTYYWLGEKKTALAAIVPPYVWGGVGLYVIIFMNAMTTIPKSLYESAVLEGAGHMTRLFRITMPLIMPLIRVSALFLVLGSLKGFEKQMILTNGGPAGSTDVIGLYIFNLAFGAEYHNYGYASAIGMFLFVILVTAKLLMDKFLPDRSVEY